MIRGVELLPETPFPDNSTYAADFYLYDRCQTQEKPQQNVSTIDSTSAICSATFVSVITNCNKW